MTLMRIREINACPKHPRTTIVLEDLDCQTTLTFYADRDEARRLTQEIARRGCACHPIYDFVRALFLALDGDLTRVVLEDAGGRGIGGRVYVRSGESELGVPCYAPDALALALRANVPVYATADALARSERVMPGKRDEPPDVAQWLAHVRPGDFSARGRDDGKNDT